MTLAEYIKVIGGIKHACPYCGEEAPDKGAAYEHKCECGCVMQVGLFKLG